MPRRMGARYEHRRSTLCDQGGGRQAFPCHPLSPRDQRDDTRNRRIISDLTSRGIEYQPQLGELRTPPQHPLPMRKDLLARCESFAGLGYKSFARGPALVVGRIGWRRKRWKLLSLPACWD